jgi:spermidine synthase
MWTLIASAVSDGNRLDLYERNGRHMIRADGWELMNGEYHASEDQLGRLAGLLTSAPQPQVLVGGLGLGYTLASLLQTLSEGIRPTGARITVAERSGAVLRWFSSHINPRLAATLPPDVRLTESDVADHLGADRCWDVIVLDVDNGPKALSAPGNAALYGPEGLARCRDSLAPSGHLLVWSGFDDGEFVARAGTAGLSVTCQSVSLPNRADQAHLLYVLSRRPLLTAERDRLGLASVARERAASPAAQG